ncbi:MAG: NAD(P)H-dependent oxidoreductase [Campylobacteraceae bacterium]|nr:NAD(P)H-dependent oxidoreductase [Campylobacteraceae bacterium]
MTFKETLSFRHACKIFDENKKISDSDFLEIMEAARLSPSSLGLQHWEFWLIKNKELKAKLRKACWNQVQLTSCSHLVVVFARIKDLKPGSEYIQDEISRRVDKTSEQHAAYVAKVENFIKSNVGTSDLEIFAWSKAQTFLAVQNMMSMAATLGIDSCPIEGWDDENEVQEILGVDKSDKRVAVIMPFGYRVNEQKSKNRRSLDEILKVIE